MDCPVCKTERLVMAERHGIEIDYCPACRGVWLDRGELDKIIERANQDLAQAAAAAPPAEAPRAAPPPRDYGHHGHGRDDDYRRHGHRRKSFWHDLFD